MIMKFQIRHIVIGCLAALFGAGMSSCSDDTFSSIVNGDNTTVNLNIGVPQFEEKVVTRMGVCDPDGEAIKSISLLCFDKDGNFLKKVLTDDPGMINQTVGTVKVQIPAQTSHLHILGNVNVTNIDNDNYAGLNENTLMASLYSGPGLDNYWGYVRADTPDNLKAALAATNETNYIELTRNQAQITATDQSGKTEDAAYTIDGIAVCNMNQFGTVVPMDYTNLTSNPFAFSDYSKLPLTLLTDDKNVKASDPTEVENGSEYNLFENKNSQDDPVAVILKVTHGGNTKYHKILLIDDNGTFMEIHRNHRYNIKITGINDPGYDTFTGAVDGVSANDYLITIEDLLPSITYGNFILTAPTSIIYNKDGVQTISFTCTYKDGSELSATDRALVMASWATNNVAKSTCPVTYDSDNKCFNVSIDLTSVGSTMKSGILYVGMKNSILRKPIHIYSVSGLPLNFRVSENIYDAISKPVVVAFDIPNDFPAELLPLTFKISTNRYDADQTYNTLQVINEPTTVKDAKGNDVPLDWNYKYLYKATKVGPQRVYFKTIDSGYGNGGSGSKNTAVYLEDEKGYFNATPTTGSNFSFETANQNIITLSDPYYTKNTDGTYTESAKTQDALSFDNKLPTKNAKITINYYAGAVGDLNIYTKNFSLAGAGTPTTDNGIKKYTITSCAKSEKFVFTSDVARYDDLIWFESTTNQSGSVAIHTQANCTATVTATTPNYGVGNSVDLTITFPVSDGTIPYKILTKNLTAVAGQGLEAIPGVGYKYTPTSASVTLHFTTNKVVCNETVKVTDFNKEISLTEAKAELQNNKITGTITSPSSNLTFAYIEDASHNRIGSIALTGTTYTLSLYSYYSLKLSDNVTFHAVGTVTDTDNKTVSKNFSKTTTLETLISNGNITVN